MKHFTRSIVFVTALAFVLFNFACQPPTTNTTSTTNANTNTALPTASPVSNAVDDARLMRDTTLPVLDSLFHNDESFAADLKGQVNLSDEQIERLRTIARDETVALRESEADDYSGTTTQARTRAMEKIREVVGQEKVAAFARFIGTRMSGEDAASGNAAENNTGAPVSGSVNAVPMDTRIVVNAPAYRMDVFENGKLIKSYKVGIGYPEFPLPVGQRRATELIYNPTWTPPDEPWVEASGKVKVGEKVDAGSSLNPLGPIKIPIGLPSLIHGGKQPARLGNFASHGCVGLTNNQVEEFARRLATLTGTDLSDEQVAEIQKDKTKTKNVKLDQPVLVELRYETIVVEDGKLKIYRDVYDRDTNTEEHLRRVLDHYGVAFDSLAPEQQTRLRTALTQMARDAKGNLDTSNESGNANGNKNANSNANANSNGNANSNKNFDSNKNSNSNDGGKVTRTVKGAKEVVIELPQLAGKGYPSPVEFDTGSGKAKPAKATNTRGRRA
ncbi:MAG: L,D-transpeptidase [Pyrinomonadaceae bacterium MAG19_C2-C3]|nr:L,D-transpeptidase [Pyrinomonadaceae bacterium MAG19_C2-C3]